MLDKLGFGPSIRDALDVTTTLCKEGRASGSRIVIDHVNQAINTAIAMSSSEAVGAATVSMLALFAQLISKQLEVQYRRSARCIAV